jgi:hypothetical protein
MSVVNPGEGDEHDPLTIGQFGADCRKDFSLQASCGKRCKPEVSNKISLSLSSKMTATRSQTDSQVFAPRPQDLFLAENLIDVLECDGKSQSPLLIYDAEARAYRVEGDVLGLRVNEHVVPE